MIPPAPCGTGREEDGDEENGDKDMPRSPRDAKHAGREATGMKLAWGCCWLGDCHQALLPKSSPTQAEGCRKATRHRNKVPLLPHPGCWTLSTLLSLNAISSLGRGLFFLVPQHPHQDTHMDGRWG